MPLWTDIVQAIGAVLGSAIAIVGFIFVQRQIRQVAQAIQSETLAELTAQSIQILEKIGEWPATYPYFYEKKELVESCEHRVQVLMIAEMIANYLDNCAQQDDNMSSEAWGSWRAFIVQALDLSPIVRQHIQKYSAWYSRDLHAMIENQK